jgi:catecholate siderophore receptor
MTTLALAKSHLPLLFPVLFFASLWGQSSPPGLVRGNVLDSRHAPIQGAAVETVSVRDGLTSTTLTEPSGDFALSLSPGKYMLRISMTGFRQLSQSVDLPASGLDLHDIALELAPVNATVTVAENGAPLSAITRSATKTLTPLSDVPQSVSVIDREQVRDRMLTSIGDLVNYVPGVTAIQGENNRDQLVIRGNSTSADFFLNGVRDDVQYYRDLYNLESVEVLKGPNSLAFGRGGAGGVVNRVTKEAGPAPLYEISLDGGSFGAKRVAIDFDQPLSGVLAFRLNGVYENSGSFRDYVNLRRWGINPTISYTPGANTKIAVSYEQFRDNRGSDRGVPSFFGRPLNTPVNTFFGNPDYNGVHAVVNIGIIAMEHQIGALNIRNRLSVADYDRGYQNFVPGAVTADGLRDSLSAYNNATARRNIFNQTDLNYIVHTGRIRHSLAGGLEAGRQITSNFRNTGYFNNTDTAVLVPVSDPVIHIPVTFRQSATDANNHLVTNLGAVYVQDQVEFTRRLQIIAGLRLDHFDLQYHDNRSGANLRRIDNLVSPRGGVVFKPVAVISIYASYSVSHLPSSGDQFSSLTTITQQVKPEAFQGYEVGVKWSMTGAFALTADVYRLDRTNTRSTDPNDATRIIQTGSQRTNGFELGWNGNLTRKWKTSGGYAYQDAFIVSATTSAPARAQVAQVPHNTFSLWNFYQIAPRWGAGVGLLNRSDMFAAIDNSVVLPGYTRLDGAIYYLITERARLQVNLQNLTNRKYALNADNNNNISPGSPFAVRAGLTWRF